MTLKKYIELWIYRHNSRRRRKRANWEHLLELLQAAVKSEQYNGLETGEELAMWLWWSVSAGDQPLIYKLIRSYRGYCYERHEQPEKITLI